MYWLKIPLTMLWVWVITLCILILYDLIPWIMLHHTQVKSFVFLLYGMLAYLIFRAIISARSLLFFDVFFHELSHGIFALLTFSPLRSFVVSPHSSHEHLGYVEHSGSNNTVLRIIRAHLISLAPYFFSPVTVLAMGLYYLLVPYAYGYPVAIQVLLVVIGFSYLYHLSVSFKDMRPFQTDFDYLGFKYSFIFVIMIQLVFLVWFILLLSTKFYSFYQFKLILNRRIYDTMHLLDTIQNFLVKVWDLAGGLL